MRSAADKAAIALALWTASPPGPSGTPYTSAARSLGIARVERSFPAIVLQLRETPNADGQVHQEWRRIRARLNQNGPANGAHVDGACNHDLRGERRWNA